MTEVAPFRKINDKDYEVQIEGRTKAISVPFGKVEQVFAAFIANGGVIDPDTGEVTIDLLTLISSFKDVGNILLTEFDDAGAIITEGSCAKLSTLEVISLFQLATEVIENFIKGLAALQKKPAAPSEQAEQTQTTP